MANKVIERKDLVASNAITDITTETKALITALEKILTAQKEVLKNNPFKNSADVKAHNKVTQEANATTKALLATRKKLEESRASGAVELAKEKIALQEQNKANKEAAKEKLKLVDAYQKESKRLNELRKQYKALAVAEGKSTKETRKLQKEIGKLDKELKDVDASAGQFQRNVGDYPQVMGNAASSLAEVASTALTLSYAFDTVKGALDSSGEGSENTRKITSALGGVFSQTANVVSGAALDLWDYGSAVVSNTQSGKGLIESLTDTENQFKRTDKATTNFVEKVKESVDAEVDLTEALIEVEKSMRPLEIRLSKLNGLIEIQNSIAGDSTRTFEELNAAVLKGQELQVQRSAVLITISKKELDIAKERVRIAQLSSDGTVSVALLDAETQAVIKLADAENALAVEMAENDKEIRQIRQDRLERDLDIFIDGFDNQKTINERIIANEKETLARRAELFEKTTELANKSFESQKKVLEELSKAGIDVDELLGLDATELQKRIRLLEQSEIIEGRTLEVIRERRTVLQDLEEAQADLNDSENEAFELRNDIISQQKKLSDSDFDLEKARTNNKINEIKKQLESVKDGSIEELRLNKELNDALIEQNETAEDEKKETNKKTAEEKEAQRIDDIETVEKGVNAISEAMNRASEQRLNGFDRETAENATALDRQERRAEQGLENNAAALQAQQDKLEAQRAREQKDQERKQKILAYFNLAAEYAKDDANTAPFKALATIGVMESVTALFEQGTDQGVEADMSGSKVRSTGKDDYLGRTKSGKAFLFDGREKIMGIQHSAALTDYSNQQIVDIVQNSERGGLTASIALNDSRIVSRLDSLEKSINNSKVSLHIDENAFVTHTQFVNGMKKVSKSKPKRLS